MRKELSCYIIVIDRGYLIDDKMRIKLQQARADILPHIKFQRIEMKFLVIQDNLRWFANVFNLHCILNLS